MNDSGCLDPTQTINGSLKPGIFHDTGSFPTSANFDAICKFCPLPIFQVFSANKKGY